MVEPRIEVDISRGLAKMNNLGKRVVPKAISGAINDTAFDAQKEDLPRQIRRRFDRPTPYTQKAFYVRPKATPARLSARIYAKDFGGKGTPPAKYLRPGVYGGGRNQKRSERALQMRGLMPRGWSWVPGDGARVDKYGNISGGLVKKILSALQAGDPTQWTTTRSRQRHGTTPVNRYFVVMPNSGSHLHPGVWEHYGARMKKIRPILMYVKRVAYEPRLPIDQIIPSIVKRNLPRNFNRWLKWEVRKLER